MFPICSVLLYDITTSKFCTIEEAFAIATVAFWAFTHFWPLIEPLASTLIWITPGLNLSSNTCWNTFWYPWPRLATNLLSILPLPSLLYFKVLSSFLTCNFLPNLVPNIIPSTIASALDSALHRYWLDTVSYILESIRDFVRFLTIKHSVPIPFCPCHDFIIPLPTVFVAEPDSWIAFTFLLSFLLSLVFLTEPFINSFCFSIAFSRLLFWEPESSICFVPVPLWGVEPWAVEPSSSTIFFARSSISSWLNSLAESESPPVLELLVDESSAVSPPLSFCCFSGAGIFSSMILYTSSATSNASLVFFNLSIFLRSKTFQIFKRPGKAERFLFTLVILISLNM